LNPNGFYKIFIFSGSPYDWPGTVVRELGQTNNNCAIKKIDKIKNHCRMLVSGKFSTNLYVKGTCFAEIMAFNECLRSGM